MTFVLCCRNDMADAVIKRAFAIKQNRSLQQTVRFQRCNWIQIRLSSLFFSSQAVFWGVDLLSSTVSAPTKCSPSLWNWSGEPMNWQSSIPSMRILGESHSHVPYQTSHPPFLISPDTHYDCMTHDVAKLSHFVRWNNQVLNFSVLPRNGFWSHSSWLKVFPPRTTTPTFWQSWRISAPFTCSSRSLISPHLSTKRPMMWPQRSVSVFWHQSVFSPACIRLSLIPRPLQHFTHFFSK